MPSKLSQVERGRLDEQMLIRLPSARAEDTHGDNATLASPSTATTTTTRTTTTIATDASNAATTTTITAMSSQDGDNGSKGQGELARSTSLDIEPVNGEAADCDRECSNGEDGEAAADEGGEGAAKPAAKPAVVRPPKDRTFKGRMRRARRAVVQNLKDSVPMPATAMGRQWKERLFAKPAPEEELL